MRIQYVARLEPLHYFLLDPLFFSQLTVCIPVMHQPAMNPIQIQFNSIQSSPTQPCKHNANSEDLPRDDFHFSCVSSTLNRDLISPHRRDCAFPLHQLLYD